MSEADMKIMLSMISQATLTKMGTVGVETAKFEAALANEADPELDKLLEATMDRVLSRFSVER